MKHMNARSNSHTKKIVYKVQKLTAKIFTTTKKMFPNSTHLPPELVAQILSRVDEQCLKNARLVCWLWKSVVDQVFCKFHGLLSDDNLKYILNSTLHFDEIQVCDLITEHLPISSNSMSRSKLALSPRKVIFSENSVCSLCPSVSSKNMTSILKLNRDMEFLCFEYNSLKCIKSLQVDHLVLRNLNELHISTRMSADDRDDINILQEIGKMKIPKLSVLKLTSRIVFENEGQTLIWYFKLYEFIAKYRKTLKRLEFRDGITFLSPDDLNNNSPLTTYPLSKFTCLKQKLAQCQLTSLSIEFNQMEGYDQSCLGFHLLAAQRQLTKLEICRDTELHPSYVSHVADALETNCTTLTQVVFAYLRDLSPREFSRISKALSLCTKVQSLELMLFNYPNFPYPLPISIKNLMLVGSLDPNLLLVIKQALRVLETLQFHNVTPDYILREEEYVTNLKHVTTMSSLISVLFSSPKMNYLPILTSLSDLVMFQESSQDVCFFRLSLRNPS